MLRVSRILRAVCAAGALLAAGPARADDPLSDSLGPRALGLGEALRAGASGAAAIPLNPAGIGLTHSYVIEGNYGFARGNEATRAGASVCDSTGQKIASCLYYNYFDAAPDGGERSLHEIGVASSLNFGERILLGINGKWVDYSESGSAAQPMDGSRDGDWIMDAGLILRATPQVNLAFVGYDLVGHDADNFPRAIGTGISAGLTPNVSISADARWNIEGDTSPGRYSAGLEFFLAQAGAQAGFPLRGGYVYDEATGASYASGGVGYVTPKVALDVGIRKQVSEGDELAIQFGLRMFLPTVR